MAIWIVFGVAVLILDKWPELLGSISKSIGFEVGSNFLFELLILFLVFVVMQLSSEVGKLESETQKLAEEIAIMQSSNTMELNSD